MYNILICDDEQDIVNALKIYLSGGDYCLFEASNGREALEVVEKNDIHLILMDIMMPQLDGIAATAKLREKSNVPIILLTAKSESSDKVLGLNIGADDYITKPFLAQELLLRLGAVLRRVYRQPAPPEADRLGETELCWGAGVLRRAGREIPLTAKEFTLLKTLWANRGNIVTIDALCAALWTGPLVGYENTLMVHIRRLREKLEADPSHPKYLKTVRGLGYRLVREERP